MATGHSWMSEHTAHASTYLPTGDTHH